MAEKRKNDEAKISHSSPLTNLEKALIGAGFLSLSILFAPCSAVFSLFIFLVYDIQGGLHLILTTFGIAGFGASISLYILLRFRTYRNTVQSEESYYYDRKTQAQE